MKISAMTKAGALALLAACAIMAVSCGGGGHDRGGAAPTGGVNDYLSTVEAPESGTVGSVEEGTPPAPSGGPNISVDPPDVTVVNGGSSEVVLFGPVAFTKVFVSVSGSTVDGFFVVALPEPVQSVRLQLTLQQELPEDQFQWVFAVADGSGRVGSSSSTAVQVETVGTGDVQVSVSWDRPSDVDLHVVDPSGEEIYYGNDQAASGGTLDLDSNAACSIDGVNNENITWPTGEAPRGTYVVRVDYWDSCGVEQTNYVVTVQRTGFQAQTFRGTFTGPGDNGGLGDGVEVTRFTF